jgi:DHA3 family macrolide efflux protein-like MFS transporter
MNVGGAPITVLGPALSEKVLKAGAFEYGLLQGAWFLGIAFGAFIIGKWKPNRLWVGLAIGFQGVAQLGIGMSGLFSLTLVLFMLHGIFMSVANIPLFSFVQKFVPTEQLPHIFSILGTVVMAVNPLAFAGSGYLAEIVGIQQTYILGSILPILATLLIVLPSWLKNENSRKSEEVAR